MRIHNTLAFITLLSTSLSAQVPNYVPTDGLMGWWPFNGNADDESGNGNDGSVNGASLAIDRFGISGRSFSFDGMGNTIQTSNAIITGQVQMTVSFWALTSSDLSMDVVQQACGTDCADDVRFQLNADQCNLNGLSFKSPAHFASAPFSTNDGAWHHYVMVLGRNSDFSYQNIEFYIDGVQYVTSCGQNWGGWTYTIPDHPFRIGDTGPLGNYFLGRIDDIGVWQRALSASEVDSLYVPGIVPCISSVPVSLSGLASSYTLSDVPATLVGDPEGGVFIGPGISGNNFDPAAAGLGIHSITYTYVDSGNCINTVGQCTEVVLNVGVDGSNMSSNAGVRVYPNPNRGQFTVELDLTGLVGLQVYDARGSLVHNEIFSASGLRTQRILDLSILPQGSYTLRVQHDGSFVNQTVVVE